MTGDHLPDPHLEFAFEVRAEIEPARRVGGGGPGDVLWFVPITGGTVSGPRFSGTVVPGGGDWYVDRDGVSEVDAHYLIQHDDGTLVDIRNRGFFHAAPGVVERMDAGEHVDEREFYFRMNPRFRTDSVEHGWMSRTIFVGLGRQEGSTICIRFFALS